MTPFLTIIVSDYKFGARTGAWWDCYTAGWIQLWLQGSTYLLDEYNHYID